ncbi:MAG: DUF2786 domain-containing protein, partial [Pseudomonadota bacterium]|nr:DUF2786 domain-containing protein [Pseudomonadota bacterium]
GPASTDQLRALIPDLLAEATGFIALIRVEETARGWLARAGATPLASDRDMLLVADALGMATDLALFTPSASGATAFDRLARSRSRIPRDERQALGALRQTELRLLRVDALEEGDVAVLRDLATGEPVRIIDDSMPANAVGVSIIGRLAPLGDGSHVFVSGVTPLDEAGLAVAMRFVRPGGRGLVNVHRCAEAVYCHVLRHGKLEIPGLNRPPEGAHDHGDEFPFGDDESELDALAHRWAEAGGAQQDPADLQLVRTQADLGTILDMVVSSAMARDHGHDALADAYSAIVLIQLETVQRRAQAGSGAGSLDAVAAALDAAIGAGDIPRVVRSIFDELRRRAGGVPGTGRGDGDADLERLIGRIQALRAKTVDQGCTEQEALAAAEKVAELLDRHGLQLSELDLRRQACAGMGIETGRKRLGPIDDCVPAIAAFFDCRAWAEKDPAGGLRYVFFGLPADVEAARYLYDLVEIAFETETGLFRADSLYTATHPRRRRTASNSFQIGLARGIVTKLHQLRAAREAALRGSSGRDLVPLKQSIVDEELAKLGLRLRARSRAAGRRVLGDAFEAGHEAGQRFDYRPGIVHADG